jgi:hypothetical protein
MGVLLEFQRRLEAGTWARTASTGMKDPGTQTPETATTEECSSYSTRGDLLVAMGGLTLVPRESSFTGPSSSGDVTGDRGGSGAPLDSAG